MTDKKLEPITSEAIKQIISEHYNDIQNEVKRYSKKFILHSLGIEQDTWGHIQSIDKTFKDLLINHEEIQELKNNIINILVSEIKNKFKNKTELSNNYINKQIINSIIKKVIISIKDEIEIEITAQIKEMVETEIKPLIKEEIYENSLIREFLIRKI